jgi:hypothetical protein
LPAASSAQLSTTTSTQDPPTVSTLNLAASSSTLLVFGDIIFQPDYSGTQEELPGLGHKFELFGAMRRDADPENSTGNSGASGGGVGGNETISATMTTTTIALAFRNLPPGIKIAALDNQLGLKYFFVNRSCGGGSPRITLLVDANGDGEFNQAGGDFAAHGHPNPFAGCPSNVWVYENLTDNLGRWEVTPGGAAGPTVPVFPFVPWGILEAAVTAFPNHKVLAGFLVEDSCSFFPAACGEAHYDLVTIENRTLEIWQDTVQK